MTDFDPDLAKKFLAMERTTRPCKVHLTGDKWLLLKDFFAPISKANSDLFAYHISGSRYVRIDEISEGNWIIVAKQGMIFDKNSTPRIFWPVLPRDGLPVSSTIHDAIYSEMRYRERKGCFHSKEQARDFRKVADWIFREHLDIDLRGRYVLQNAVYRAVRRFGGDPKVP